MRGLVNGLGGTVMELDWKWPDPPTTPRDIIAGHCRNWGRRLAYNLADTLLIELATRGFSVTAISCERCHGRGYLVADAEWDDAFAAQCPDCADRRPARPAA